MGVVDRVTVKEALLYFDGCYGQGYCEGSIAVF